MARPERSAAWTGSRLALLTGLVAVVMLIDGYDLQIMALLIAPLAAQWSAEMGSFGIVQAAAAGGLGIGSAFIAPLGDRFGRRRLVLGGFAVLTISVAGTGFSTGISELFWWRLLTGIALGATLINASALLAGLGPAGAAADGSLPLDCRVLVQRGGECGRLVAAPGRASGSPLPVFGARSSCEP